MVQDTNKSINKQRLLGTRALEWPTGAFNFRSEIVFPKGPSANETNLHVKSAAAVLTRMRTKKTRQNGSYKNGASDGFFLLLSLDYFAHNNSEHPLGCELNGKLKNQVICVEFAQVSFTRTKRFSRSLTDLLILTDRCCIGNHSIYLSSVS
ncbi:hypothetical protein RUM43_001566 [Polyplax serrata]|uniref:Uncharacterized protein n=1 Tax=Polyplax serrata TaxID=468196 RepID=A0AAN8SJR2_POLSC